MPRIGTVIREVYHRPAADGLPAHLEDHYGIQVSQGFVPYRSYITALAGQARAHSGRPA
jgi:hypothetical protein